VADNTQLAEGTVANGEAPKTGLPQMDTATFPGQIFWLAVTFAFLFVMMSRFAVPRIAGAIGARRGRIEGDLGTAESLRKDAANALAGYESALAGARSRALQLANENRKRVVTEMEQIKSQADATAQAGMADAERRIADQRARAAASTKTAAAEAAAEIVERLIGERVSAADAERALNSASTRG
jgi:F-type H+-transporting ATPase subunit b